MWSKEMPPKRAKKQEVPSEDIDESGETSNDEDDTEGSLVDFIEHDSAEQEDEGSYHEDDSEEEEDSDATSATEPPEEAAEEEEDSDEVIKRQYNEEMERSHGSVVTQEGVRRSMRSTKGRAPVRYVDEDYVELMFEDTTPDEIAALVNSDSTDEEEEEAHVEEDEEEEEEEEEEPPPPPPKKRQRRRVLQDDE
jgi:hypothetical protein